MRDDQAVLLRLAREAIATQFSGDEPALPATAALQTPAAVFVTLRRQADGTLRGCIGSIEPRLPLGRAVVTAARAAAFRDIRFPPLSQGELASVRLEVTLLSPLRSFPVADEDDARRQLARTRPGLVLRYRRRHGVLLPKVWEAVDDAAEFLRHLKVKAGLPPAFWSESIELLAFTGEDFAEPDDWAAFVGTT